jgi:Zn-dependent protease with chaperone function
MERPMSKLKALPENAFCLCVIVLIILSCALSTSFAAPKRAKTVATYYCNIDSQGKARLDFSLLTKAPLTEEQKSGLENALGLQLSDRMTRYNSNDPEETEDAMEEELSEEEYIEETERQQKTEPSQRNHLLFGVGTRYFSKRAFQLEGDLNFSDLIQVLRDLKVDDLLITISHMETVCIECTKSPNDELPESMANHFHSYVIALSDGATEPSTVHISFGYSASSLVKKFSVMGVIFLLPILFIALKRRRLTRLAEIDSVSARFSAFRSLNMLFIGFPLVWLMAYSLVGVNEAFSFIGTGRGALFKLLVMLVWYMVFPTISLLICKALLYPFLSNADDKQFKLKHFLQESLILVFAIFLPLLFLLAGIVALIGGETAFGFGYLAASYISREIAKPLQQKTEGVTAYALVVKSLRDRVFEIASRAGVTLTEVYVLPVDKDKSANAFATTKNTVLLNEYLLRRLSRREVDAVVAHEIGHLRLNHPRMLSICFYIGFLIPVILPFFLRIAMTYLSSISIKFFYLSAYLEKSDVLFPISIGISTLAFLVLSRRFEYSADAFSVTVTGDAEAMITALIRLSRLSLLPMDWGKFDENLLTHPSTMNRIKSLAGKYGVSPERLSELIQASAEPEDSYSLQETGVPLTAPATNNLAPVLANQAHSSAPTQAKKKALKYTLMPLQTAFFSMLFLFFLLRQVQTFKQFALASGLPQWSIILLGGGAILMVSSYLIKRQLVRLMPTKIQFFRTHTKKYSALDVCELERYTTELTELGFEQLIDFTLENFRQKNLQPFGRLFVHPQQKCFAEISQIIAGSISVTKMNCSLVTILDGGWDYTTKDKETDSILYVNRLPRSLFESKEGVRVHQLFHSHLSRRDEILGLLNREISNDLTFESYLTIGSKLEFAKREKMRKQNSFLFLLDWDKCERQPKSSWFGKLEKQINQERLEQLVASKAKT